jgi:hypothetical protein
MIFVGLRENQAVAVQEIVKLAQPWTTRAYSQVNDGCRLKNPDIGEFDFERTERSKAGM